MSNYLTAKEALDVALHGSPEYRQKAASATSDTQIPLDTVLSSHLAIKNELLKIATYFQETQPQNPFIEPLIKVADLVGCGYPAKPAAAKVIGNDKKEYDKLAASIDDMKSAVLCDSIVEDFKVLKEEHLLKKASALGLSRKYPNLARVAPKLAAFREKQA